ncbi:MAG: RNA polymerase sigma factor [Acidobacteriota bacterium]
MTEPELRQAFEDHKDSVYDFALRMTGSEAVAEDVAQDCFLELLRNPRGFDRTRGSLRTFLFGVTRHLVYRQWRNSQRLVPVDGLFEDELGSYSPDLTSGSTATIVREAVQALPALQREAVLLFEYEGFTLEEIASIANVDVGTVKSRLHRAREKLRQVLAPLRNHTGVQHTGAKQ